MTNPFSNVIVSSEKNRATGSGRKGNAADTYTDYRKFISPVRSSGYDYAFSR